MQYSTFEKAKLRKAIFASVGCTNCTIAVIPDGGSNTLSRSPNLPNVFLSSSTLVPWGKFFTRITVLLFLALAYNRHNDYLLGPSFRGERREKEGVNSFRFHKKQLIRKGRLG